MANRGVVIIPAQDEGRDPIDPPWTKTPIPPETAEYLDRLAIATGKGRGALIAEAVRAHFGESAES